jgi:hypothetical protein
VECVLAKELGVDDFKLEVDVSRVVVLVEVWKALSF